MDILLGILLIALLSLYFAYIRRKPENRVRSRSEPSHPTGEVIDISSSLAGTDCIYTDGVEFMKVRIHQAEMQDGQIQIRLQPLRSEGLSDCVDDALNISAPTNTLERSDTYMHAPYAGWKLFLDPKLVAEITDLARTSEDLQAVKQALLDHRMQTVA